MLPVSVCLTTYNRAHKLPDTIDSILGQSFGDFELIVSDDYSCDGTRELCEQYARRDRRVRYVRNFRNLGMPGNLNAAIARASGKYVANLHDGDIYHPRLIQEWKSVLDECSNALFVFNAYDIVSESGEHRIHREPFSGVVPGKYIALHFFRTATSCVWGTVMARATAYRASGGFDAAFGFISDVDMWLRLACGKEVGYVDTPLITITPREGDKPQYGWPWQHWFWTLGIYSKALTLYRTVMPAETAEYAQAFPRIMRRLAISNMLFVSKHRQWRKMREGLAMWKDSPDILLRAVSWLIRRELSPSWYTPTFWAPLRTIPKTWALPKAGR